MSANTCAAAGFQAIRQGENRDTLRQSERSAARRPSAFTGRGPIPKAVQLRWGLLIAVLFPGILLHTADKQFPVPEFQHLTALHLVEGHDTLPGVYPDLPQMLFTRDTPVSARSPAGAKGGMRIST